KANKLTQIKDITQQLCLPPPVSHKLRRQESSCCIGRLDDLKSSMDSRGLKRTSRWISHSDRERPSGKGTECLQEIQPAVCRHRIRQNLECCWDPCPVREVRKRASVPDRPGP